MELSNELIFQLNVLGVNPYSLSRKEEFYIIQINKLFEEYIDNHASLIEKITNNKFTLTSVSEKMKVSRQFIYLNPTIKEFYEYCEYKAEKMVLKTKFHNSVEKEKYDLLLIENKRLTANIVVDELKDIELKRLIDENKNLLKRIDKLTSRIESSRKKDDISKFKIKN